MESKKFAELWKTIKILREKCPWDRKQTNESIKNNLIEEAFEAVESIEEKNWIRLREELGDLLLVILMHTRIAEQEGKFNLVELLDELNKKLIKRHPHVFKNVKFEDEKEFLKFWEKSKNSGKLGNVNFKMPALLLAQILSKRASKWGFDWRKVEDIFDKLDEELKELKEAVENKKYFENSKEKIEEEIGDILFVITNIARHLDIDAEEALRKTCKKFKKRIEIMEKLADKDFSEMSLEELDRLWEKAKEMEKNI